MARIALLFLCLCLTSPVSAQGQGPSGGPADSPGPMLRRTDRDRPPPPDAAAPPGEDPAEEDGGPDGRSSFGIGSGEREDEGDPARSSARPAAPDDPVPNAASYWRHNGSLVALVADGTAREFRYVRPRAGLAPLGVAPGTLLFRGRILDGARYEGSAYLFKAGCPPAGYSVSGTVERDATRIVLSGEAPRRDAACKATGAQADELTFDYVGTERPE